MLQHQLSRAEITNKQADKQTEIQNTYISFSSPNPMQCNAKEIRQGRRAPGWRLQKIAAPSSLVIPLARKNPSEIAHGSRPPRLSHTTRQVHAPVVCSLPGSLGLPWPLRWGRRLVASHDLVLIPAAQGFCLSLSGINRRFLVSVLEFVLPSFIPIGASGARRRAAVQASGFFLSPGPKNRGMDGNARSAASQKKPIVMDTTDLVELLWHNGGVVAQSQRPPPNPSAAADRGGQSTSGLTGEETAAWFPDAALEDDDMYAQLWHSVTAAPDGVGGLPGPSSRPPPDLDQTAAAAARPPMSSSWTGDICSTFCGSNQGPVVPAGGGEGSAALPSEGTRGTSTRDGAGTFTGTSSSGGSGSNFGASGLPSESTHGGHKRKGRGRDDSDSRSEDAECEATEETKSSRRHGSKRRSRAAEVHNQSERRRRDRINEKMRSLQELIPHCNKADKASILDEAIEYLKSLQMQLQIMWMTTGMAPMMFPGAHQFMPPMAMGMNSACMPTAQGLNQMPRVPYINHSLPNHIPMNSSPAMNPMYVANQMQNIHLREASNHFQVAPQVTGPYAYASQVAQQNQIPEVPDSTIVPTSGNGQPPTSDGI